MKQDKTKKSKKDSFMKFFQLAVVKNKPPPNLVSKVEALVCCRGSRTGRGDVSVLPTAGSRAQAQPTAQPSCQPAAGVWPASLETK